MLGSGFATALHHPKLIHVGEAKEPRKGHPQSESGNQITLDADYPLQVHGDPEKCLFRLCRISGCPFLWLNMCLSRQQPIYSLAKPPAGLLIELKRLQTDETK